VAQLCVTPAPQSSLEATRVRALTALPVYTARTVLMLLPAKETCHAYEHREGEGRCTSEWVGAMGE
jgi:hypothetical protein